ncbi:inhibitor of nuclear factor kappa-B kinase-interacting protein isoform X1 [Antechinus flavipes]|uniref:inhibitor of nuclear factor kappa-B kinase-interacting protein isoform X1 n=2 Tax=Antechinus flavipes TaxID=38775 RepID=UPI002235D8E7|nr:inhibitor of nuclear factor kappa-B kinase-interacting protein isoform X1 [Antechinus flavipes]
MPAPHPGLVTVSGRPCPPPGPTDMSEAKHRKKAGAKGAPPEPGRRGEAGQPPEPARGAGGGGGGGGGWADPRTVLCLLSLGTSLALAWFVFQQSEKFDNVENKYQLLKLEATEFHSLQSQVDLISEKLESTESVLQETTSAISLMTQFEQEVSSLHNVINDIKNSEQMLMQRMQTVNMKFKNVTDSWKRNLDDMNAHTGGLKSEAKRMHSHVTGQINLAEQGIKLLTERLKDLEDSTMRNIRTIKRQEEDDLLQVEEQLVSDTKAVEQLEEEQRSLFAREIDLSNKLTDYEPKVEECKTHLPALESAVHSVLKVSQDLIGTEKKMEDLTMKMFNMEDGMLKAVSDIMDMQKALEGMQYDNSMLKMQNELHFLKGKVQEFIASSSIREKGILEYDLENKGIGEQ